MAPKTIRQATRDLRRSQGISVSTVIVHDDDRVRSATMAGAPRASAFMGHPFAYGMTVELADSDIEIEHRIQMVTRRIYEDKYYLVATYSIPPTGLSPVIFSDSPYYRNGYLPASGTIKLGPVVDRMRSGLDEYDYALVGTNATQKILELDGNDQTYYLVLDAYGAPTEFVYMLTELWIEDPAV